MERYSYPNAKELIKKHKRRTVWQRLVRSAAIVVVFVTTYMMILPAITASLKNQVLDCPLDVHAHTKECYNDASELICGQADYVVHTHDDNCYDEEENLVCKLPEIPKHTHDESCYETRTELVCGMEEGGHRHEEFCYTASGELTCTEEEWFHQHDETCYETKPVLICGKLELHTHDDEACYDENGVLICGLPQLQEHIHGNACFKDPSKDDDDKGADTPDTTPVPDASGTPGHSGWVGGQPSIEGGESSAVQPDLIFRDTNIEITVSFGDGILPADTSLHATFYDPNQLNTIQTVLTNFLPKQKEQNLLGYDIFFSDAEGEVQPDGPVTVTWKFLEPIAKQVAENSWALFHIAPNTADTDSGDEGSVGILPELPKPMSLSADTLQNFHFDKSTGLEKAQPLPIAPTPGVVPERVDAAIAVNEDGAVTSVTFQADHFSPFVLAEVNDEGPVDDDDDFDYSQMPDPNGEYEDLENYLNSAGTYTDPRGSLELLLYYGNPDSGEPPVGSNGNYLLTASGTYTFRLNIYTEPREGITPGIYTYQLPANTYVAADVQYGPLYGGGFGSQGNLLGHYWITKDGLVIIDYTSDIDTNVRGYIDCSFLYEDTSADLPDGEEVNKTGEFDPSDGKIHFKIEAHIPAYNPNETPTDPDPKTWYISDLANIGSLYAFDVLKNATITIEYKGSGPIVLKNLATETPDPSDNIAYFFSRDNNLYLAYRRDDCDEDLTDRPYELSANYPDWCTHWRLKRNADITIEYAADELNGRNLLTEEQGLNYVNNVGLYNRNSFGEEKHIDSMVSVYIPKLIQKSKGDFENGVAPFTVTVNEDFIDLTELNDNLVVEDEMNNLLFVSGSLEVHQIDEQGSDIPLSEGSGYTYKWDGPARHLTVTVFNPGKYKYVIQYKAQVILDESAPSTSFGNTARAFVGQYGDGASSSTSGRIAQSSYRDFASESVTITITKVQLGTEKVLTGATYGLFTADGTEIMRGTSDEDGQIVFKTSLTAGVVVASKVVYYIQELEAPAGYSLNPDRFYFYFNDPDTVEGGGHIPEFDEQYAEFNIQCYCMNENHYINQDMVMEDISGAVLPKTGANGTLPYAVAGLLAVAGSAVCLLYKRKRVRRKEAL